MSARSLALILWLFFATIGAQAHSALIEASPADNVLLEQAPQQVTLLFNESVTPLALQLYAPDGDRTDLTDSVLAGDRLLVPLPFDLSNGTHVLSWRVISDDGHPIAGSQIFSVRTITGASAAATTGADPAISFAIWLTRGLLYVCLFGGVGAALFAAHIAPLPNGTKRLSIAFLVAGIAAVPISLALQGLDALGRPIEAVTNLHLWSTALNTSYGSTLTLLLLALLITLAVHAHTGLASRIMSSVAVGMLAWALASSGHASAANPQWLTRPAVFIHTAAIAFWIGALIPLAALLASNTLDARQALSRFSRLIPWAIAPLVISGLALAVVQLGWPSRQWLSPYGAILLAKLALLALLFLLALLNRTRFTAPTLAGAAPARSRLQLSVRAEVILAIVILMLVAGWRFTPPPRVLAELYPEPAIAHFASGQASADITIDPGKAGPVTVGIQLGRSSTAQSVTVAFAQPELGIEPFRREASDAGNGLWRVEGLTLPAGGLWHLTLEVRVSRFEMAELAGSITLVSPPRQPVIVATLGDLQLADPFTRATLPRASVGGGYMVIINTGAEDDRLLSATTPASDHVTPHDSRIENDIMKMRELVGGIPIPAGQSVRLQPGGLHLMLEQLRAPIVQGTTVPLTLTFERAGTITINLEALDTSADGVEDHSAHSN